ncbi:type IV secretion system protein VirB8 [Klebsiella pneumoniae]|nr:type IV secretion system protein VirB8 [Klebsiella pneumoniae]
MSDIQKIVNVSRSFESILLEKEERVMTPTY